MVEIDAVVQAEADALWEWAQEDVYSLPHHQVDGLFDVVGLSRKDDLSRVCVCCVLSSIAKGGDVHTVPYRVVREADIKDVVAFLNTHDVPSVWANAHLTHSWKDGGSVDGVLRDVAARFLSHALYTDKFMEALRDGAWKGGV